MLHTENDDVLKQVIDMMEDENVQYFVMRDKNINKIIMFNPINNIKEHQRLQRVMENGLKALEKLTELGRV